jgi:hypothetical protein
MRVDAALNHCARLDQARHEASNPHSRDEIFSLNEQLRVVDSYRPHPSPGEPSIARATNGSFRKLIPAELFLKAVNSTSILDIQRLVRRSMEDMSGWNPILDDPSFPGRPLGVHVKGAGLR